MATVAVCYDISTFKVKVTPSTVLNDVLSQSLNRFGLDDRGGKWALMHGDKPMELDLPWRMMNLPTGIRLQLKQLREADASGESKLIKVRVQVPGYNSVVREVDVAQNLRSFLRELAQENNWPLEDSAAKLQIFTKTIPVRDLRDQTLRYLGVEDSLSVRLVLPNNGACAASGNGQAKNPAAAPAAAAPAHRAHRAHRAHPLHHVSAYVPPEGSLASQLKPEELDDHELTVEHARRYQQMVSRQTGGLGGPMIPKRLKEQQEAAAAARTRSIQECFLRVRFPDRTHVEVAFKPDDTTQTVYQVIARSLVDESLEFTISQSHPYVALPADDRKLVQDCQFGTKTLLLFECRSKGPYLKKDILHNAKSLGDADDVKLDRSQVMTNSDAEMNSGEESKPQHLAPSAPTTPGKYPKWLKLSKK